MGRAKAADHQDQRERILKLAVAAFARLGFASASMSELALACGVSKPGLYHYFENKESLLFEALQNYIERLRSLALQIEQEQSDGRERLRHLVSEFLAAYADAHDQHVALLYDVKFLNPQRREELETKQREVIAVFARCIALVKPEAVEDPALRVPMAMALLGTLNFTFAWLRRDGPVSYEQFGELVLGIWEKGLA